jgi:acyl-CoA synthetase (AMP-forming)/AMP-acid ligase II
MVMLEAGEIETREESGGPLTAEGLLRRRARQRPGAVALVDPQNRAAIGLGRPRSLSYGEADGAVDALASHFIDVGLAPGDRIAVQLPNVAEHALVLLAAWRAGLTVVALPMLWRGTEIARVCAEGAALALIGVASFEGDARAEDLCRIAVSEIAVRFVLGFGDGLPDGVAPLDEVIEAGRGGTHAPFSRAMPGPALVTFTARAGQPFLPVLRTEDALLAQGAMTVMALGLDRGDVILNPYPLTGQVGLSLGLAPWLISGAALALHQPFDYDAFVQQVLDAGATVTALPAPIRAELARDGVLQRAQCRLRRLGCVWSPAHLAETAPSPAAALASYFDLYPLGDVASLVLRRGLRSDPSELPLGTVQSGETGGGAVFIETKLGARADGGAASGELLLRGPVVSQGRANGPLIPDAGGFVGTGLCAVGDGPGIRLKRDPELVQHGGFAIAASELDALYQGCPGFLDAACFTLSDPMVGDRIFAAIVPRPGAGVSLQALHDFLAAREVAAYKFPDRLVVVHEIPRDAQGRVLREEILRQV